jgi:hypothetical protein
MNEPVEVRLLDHAVVKKSLEDLRSTSKFEKMMCGVAVGVIGLLRSSLMLLLYEYELRNV